MDFKYSEYLQSIVFRMALRQIDLYQSMVA